MANAIAASSSYAGGPSVLDVPVRPPDPLDGIDVVISPPAPPQVTLSSSDDDEDDAAEELAEWLLLNGTERPFLVASLHGRRLVARVSGAVGLAIGGSHATQEWAQSCRSGARDADAVVAIGGGRCLDAAKLVAAGVGVPFIAVPTQLSHDGVCSPVAVLPREAGGLAESLEAVAPNLAFFSRPTLIRAPIASLRAGFGDLIANPLALRDWELGFDAGLERINDTAWRLSEKSFRLIEPLLDEPLVAGSVGPELIGAVAEALVTSGLAMIQAGCSRPASGAEHKISHAIDELYGARAHHGAQVAFGSLLSAALHGLDVSALRQCLVNLELPHHPRQLMLSANDMICVLLRAPSTRPGRFTILERADLGEREAAVLVRGLWRDL